MQLLEVIYNYFNPDVEALIKALKEGRWGGHKHTDEEIGKMMGTKIFRERYAKYLRKQIKGPEQIRVGLGEWIRGTEARGAESVPNKVALHWHHRCRHRGEGGGGG